MKSFFPKTMKLLAVLLCAAALFVLLPAKKAEAETPDEVTQKVLKYWNTVTANGTKTAYWNRNVYAFNLMEQTAKGDYLSQVSYSPCQVVPGKDHLYVNGCTSNNWYGFSQCWGFCIYMGYLTSGVVNEGADYGVRYYSVANDFQFQPGDQVRCSCRDDGTTATHSLFVWKVENGTVHVIECNWDGNCKIGMRSFPESKVRWFVNRFNGSDNSDYLFRPNSVMDPEKVVQDWTDTVNNIAGGFTQGDGLGDDRTTFYLPQTKISCRNGESFSLSRDNALAELPNGFYLSDRFATKDISGKWEWYSWPREIEQTRARMTFNFWYYPIEYRINYEIGDGVNDPDNPDSYNVLYGVELKAPKRDGYMFLGWTLNGEKVKGINPGCRASFASWQDMYQKLAARTTGELTLTAVWRKEMPIPFRLRMLGAKFSEELPDFLREAQEAAD